MEAPARCRLYFDE
jgi:hypothetical protein